jgi:hypothetical protein
VNVIPQEAASVSEFIKWRAETLAGLFDIWAQALSAFCPRTDAGAELFEELLVGVVSHLQAIATNSLPHGSLVPKPQLAEIGIALKGRRLYWVGRMLGSVREYEEARRNLRAMSPAGPEPHEVEPAATGVAQSAMPTNQGDSQDSCAASWDTIEISFLTEYKLQISRNGSFEEPVYGELPNLA